MRDSTDWTTFLEAAAPAIEVEADRLCRRLGLREGDREDLAQELWLHLVLWWNDPRDWDYWESLFLGGELARRIGRLAEVLARSAAFHARFGLDGEQPSSHWLEASLTAHHTIETEWYRQLCLDMAAVSAQLRPDLRAACASFLHEDGQTSRAASAPRGATQAALRRIFHAHDLHTYL